MHQARVDYREAKDAINGIDLQQGSHFIYREKAFNIFFHLYTQEDQQNEIPPIFWTPVSTTAHYDVYIPWNLVPEKWYKPVLLHEALEAPLFKDLDAAFGSETAHAVADDVASHFDELYVRETYPLFRACRISTMEKADRTC